MFIINGALLFFDGACPANEKGSSFYGSRKKPGTHSVRFDKLVAQFQLQGLTVGVTNGVGCTILGLVGDTTAVDMDKISINENVERVMRVQEPYKKANRKFHPEDTVVHVGGAAIGGGSFSVIAGPCSVESEEQIIEVAQDVQKSGRGHAPGRRIQAPHFSL